MRFIVPSEAWVLACDGSKAVFYQNVGSAVHINLKAVHVLEEPHPPTRDLGTDRPGRSHDSMSSSRSSVASTDWHEEAEIAFLRQVAGALEPIAAENRDGYLVIAAPPRALGILREHLGPASRRLLRAQLDRDLVKMPKLKIESYLQAQA